MYRRLSFMCLGIKGSLDAHLEGDRCNVQKLPWERCDVVHGSRETRLLV